MVCCGGVGWLAQHFTGATEDARVALWSAKTPPWVMGRAMSGVLVLARLGLYLRWPLTSSAKQWILLLHKPVKDAARQPATRVACFKRVLMLCRERSQRGWIMARKRVEGPPLCHTTA